MIPFHDCIFGCVRVCVEDVWRNPRRALRGHLDSVDAEIQKMIRRCNEKRDPGCLGYLGEYTTQLYWDYNKTGTKWLFRGFVGDEILLPWHILGISLIPLAPLSLVWF